MSQRFDESFKIAWKFLVTHYSNQQTFTQEVFQNRVNKGKFVTYWSKRIRPLLTQTGTGRYRVSELFQKYKDWESFKKHISQKAHIQATYQATTYPQVISFQFFLPLAHEILLRAALDTFFFKDKIFRRLKTIPMANLKEYFTKNKGDSKQKYFDTICKWISNKFGGYSIFHVSGRFRANDLMTLDEATNLQVRHSTPYLIDETTAVIRFIIPFGLGRENNILPSDDIKKEADRIRYFFNIIFVQTIVEVVSGEAEIWMLESGYFNGLHVWRKT